ncbi:unnamed protein product [Clavelina lepadiformis]|uniref:Tetratricopeptide repeat protein 21B n=1 Tax=Clavelina lepadiformis TaxID=159417 RepID=A0ABP0GFP5_CLALP
MASDDLETLANLNYYMLEGYYRHVQMIVLDATRKFGSDPVLTLYKGISMLAEGRTQEGMRELEPITDKENVSIAAALALSIAHEMTGGSDHSMISSYESKAKSLRKNATDMELYFAGLTVWLIGGSRSPKDLSDQLARNFPDFRQGIVLKAWIDITSGNHNVIKKGVKMLEPALNDANRDPFAYLAKAKAYAFFGRTRHVLDSINLIVISYPKFSPALVELTRLHLANKAWDQVIDTTSRLLSINSHHPEALKMQTLYCIAREGKYSDAVNRISELIQVIDRFEPQNAELYLKSGQLFSRVCSRNMSVLKQTYTLVERAVTLKPENASYANELAHQLFLMGKYKDTVKCLNSAMAIDETSVAALVGMLRCQIVEYEAKKEYDPATLQDISDQLEFLTQLQMDPEVSFLKAVLTHESGKPQEETLHYLLNSWSTKLQMLEKSTFTTDMIIQFNPDLVMEIVRQLFKMSPTQPVLSGQTVPPTLTKCLEILDVICKVFSGMLEATYLLAKAKFLSGDMDGAASSLKHCLQQDETNGDAHLLMAQIYFHKGNNSITSQYLETALSFNFEIRDHPLYYLIKSRTLKQSGKLVECVQTLKMAFALPGVKRPVSAAHKHNKKPIVIDSNDRLSIFLELVEAHTASDEHHEAAKVMQDAMNVFQGTSEEIRVRVANADLAVNRGDIEQALAMLRAIKPDQPYYIQAKEKMAQIYLHHRKDKKLFTSCYRELVEQQPSTHSCLLLGDAYISIQEPEKAIEVYEKALRKNPKDGALASKIGQAMIKTHDYKKAIAYYETAISNGQQKHLRFELVDLLLKLKNYTKAERVLQQAAEEQQVGSDLEVQMNETRRFMLLATLFRKSSRHAEELQALKEAREVQARVLKRVQVEQPDGAIAQKRLTANICSQLANHAYTHSNDLQQAIIHHKEALIYCEDDVDTMLDLAKLYLQTGDLDSCQQYCMQALRVSTNHQDQASMMLADVMFSKKQYKDAIYHYEQLLEAKPEHYEALARLIGLLRRGGQLDAALRFLKLAEEKAGEGKAAMDAGYQYCKGLYEWYSGKPHTALQLFNRARCDGEWKEKALENMIRICLNPNQRTLGGEVFESINESAPGKDSNALSTAERLVKEFKSSDPFKAQVLDNMVLVSTKHKPNAERALANFLDICQNKKDYVPALLGMAIAYQILKQIPRARNQLKRISKMQWTSEEAEYFEQSWLLLADMYISAGKYDMATELLKKCLDQNKSCCIAYEYMGFIYEKEQSYKDASLNYEKAWEYSNQSNPAIGYKLAFNYLKAKRNIDAIDISHKVLALHPDYPRMKKDILDKARAGIRV